MFHSARAFASLVLVAAVSGCGFVDNFTPRLYDTNLNAQDVMNQETLLNIVRASQFHPPSFVQISQTSGSQNEDLKIGLPSIVFGPAKNAAAKQYVFGGNVTDSSATGGFQTTPLVTSSFQQGMMSPISPKVLALLIAAEHREPVFYATIEAVELTAGDQVYFFRNDPADDAPMAIPGDCAQIANPDIYGDDPRIGSDVYTGPNAGRCNFAKFVHVLHAALVYGITFEIADSAQPAVKPATSAAAPGKEAKKGSDTGSSSSAPTGDKSGGNATTSPTAVGQLCFDPGLALIDPTTGKRFQTPEGAVCGQGPATGAKGYTANLGAFKLRFILRSPLAVYKYLGKLLREGLADRIHYLSSDLGNLRSQPFLDISQNKYQDCLVTAPYRGVTYCVPSKATNTAMILGILQDLRNLSVTPADLNSSFSVRVID